MAFLSHIGVAVKDPNTLERLKKLFEILEIRPQGSQEVPDQGVRTHFLAMPSAASQIELLEVMDPEGTVANFIKKRGPGIHHLSFQVKAGQLDSLCERLKGDGFQLIYPTAKRGAHEMRINFIHPASSGGILIEVMEPSR